MLSKITLSSRTYGERLHDCEVAMSCIEQRYKQGKISEDLYRSAMRDIRKNYRDAVGAKEEERILRDEEVTCELQL